MQMRRIFAIGGGGFTTEAEPSPIDAYIKELLRKPRPRICFIATPSGDSTAQIDKFHTAYGSLGFETSNLSFFNGWGSNVIPYTDYKQRLLNQDAIFVGGGHLQSALAVWREWRLDVALSEAWNKGVLLTGMSAGAMCWFESPLGGPFDKDNYGVQEGLGLLEGACATHYSNVNVAERRENLLAKLQSGAIPPTLAIDDFAAVVFEDKSVDKVLSWRPGATAYRVQNDQTTGKIVENAFTADVIGSPRPERPPRRSIRVEPTVLQAYIGQYHLMSHMVLTVTQENGRLFTQLTGQEKFELYAENSREFFVKVLDAQVSFQTGDSDQVTSLILHQHGRDTTAVKTG